MSSTMAVGSSHAAVLLMLFVENLMRRRRFLLKTYGSILGFGLSASGSTIITHQESAMSKRILTVEQIRNEVAKRIENGHPPEGDLAANSLPPPKVHPLDTAGRNWDIEETKHGTAYNAYVRHVVEEARREFYLTNAIEHDEIMGGAFTHI